MQTEIELVDHSTVTLIDHVGTDRSALDAARVSFRGVNSSNPYEELSEHDQKTLDFLIKNRHGSPFEHNAMTFAIEAPIFVFREFHRHRIGFSYNEMSGRYTEMPPRFYAPPKNRPLVNSGTSGRPEYNVENHTESQYYITNTVIRNTSQHAYDMYQHLLREGIAKEVARMVLPLNLMSQMHVTTNARALMNFLSLRTQRGAEEAVYPSNPQWEIARVADTLEEKFKALFPHTHGLFNTYGRVAP